MIVLGTRSSVMTDIPNLGLIIIDEEHDASFVHDQGNHYDARHVALFRAKHLDIPVIMGSATPLFKPWIMPKRLNIIGLN